MKHRITPTENQTAMQTMLENGKDVAGADQSNFRRTAVTKLGGALMGFQMERHQ